MDQPSIRNFLTSLEQSLRSAPSEHCPVIVTGNFNCKNALWCGCDVTEFGGESLQYILDAYEYKQLVHSPTRIHQNNQKSCLDLILISRMWPQTPSVTPARPIGQSDHLTLVGTIHSPFPSPASPCPPTNQSNACLVPIWTY